MFFETSTLSFFVFDKTPIMATEGIIKELNRTLPNDVPTPPENPDTSFRKNKKKRNKMFRELHFEKISDVCEKIK